ncbi:MAG: Na/Pi cotransporter family protein [Treponema sp.]|jgi:phosphate:Na+ symporter|nr:Na/Pi cotransporter family protein [Treponema sp.]
MEIFSLLLRMTGGLCMFLFGMKVMSDGIQKSAGDRLRKTLNFMTGNRFAGALTGFVVTAIIQSSSATTVMVVSFVNAGLLTLAQSIGVIMGANIGTTVTAWVVSLVGFSIKIASLALPSIGIGFILSIVKWKHKSFGEFVMGFGFLFMGLHFLTQEMSSINTIINFESISGFSDMGVLSILIGAGAGLLMTSLIHSSSASTAIVLTMAFNGLISYVMAAAFILGANIGTTIDAVLASIGTKTAAKRSALVHVLFNVIGTLWALPLLIPLLKLVDIVTPGESMLEAAKTWKLGTPLGFGVTTHLAMLHTVFNTINTFLFLPFVKPFAKLVSLLIPEGKSKEEDIHYVFTTYSRALADTPELNIIRVEKEIRDMAGVVSSMYARFILLLKDLHEVSDKESAAVRFREEMKQKESYVDEMREILTAFLIECTRRKLNPQSERRVTRLLRVISDIEEMSDECYGISCLLERSARKNRVFKKEEMDELVPYVGLVEEFLALLQEKLGQGMTIKSAILAKKLEADIGKSRKKLQKLSRKRIEAGKDVQTELLFIDLVRRIEKLGDYCGNITEKLSV